MEPEIRTAPIEYFLVGASLRHDPAKCYGEEIIALLNRVWPVIKGAGIKNDGINRVVYDADGTVFAGVIADGADPQALGLERKHVQLTQYAYCKHIGPYRLLHQACDAMNQNVKARGYRTTWPMVEVYGHWSDDESKLETDLFMAVC